MTKGHGEKRTRKQAAAIAALLTASTLKEAAETVGIGDQTLWRWMKNPEFAAEYRDAKRQTVSQAITRIQQSCGEAVDVLREIMGDVQAPAANRVQAAKTMLEMALRATEIEELENRIEQLEAIQDTRLRGVR